MSDLERIEEEIAGLNQETVALSKAMGLQSARLFRDQFAKQIALGNPCELKLSIPHPVRPIEIHVRTVEEVDEAMEDIAFAMAANWLSVEVQLRAIGFRIARLDS